MIRRIFGIEEKVYFFLKKTEAVDNDGARRMLAKTVAVSSWAFIATAGLGTSMKSCSCCQSAQARSVSTRIHLSRDWE